jgi:hypothetical protein
VFAVGDVRAGSTKRVAAAVGEGTAVVAQIHTVFALAGAGLTGHLRQPLGQDLVQRNSEGL